MNKVYTYHGITRLISYPRPWSLAFNRDDDLINCELFQLFIYSNVVLMFVICFGYRVMEFNVMSLKERVMCRYVST